MKTFKKALSLILVLALCLGLCAGAFADGSSGSGFRAIDEDGEGGVLILGDSFSAGFGSSENYLEEIYSPDQFGYSWMRWITGAYTSLLAEGVGCTREANPMELSSEGNFWPCVMGGMPVTAILDLFGIEDNFDDENYYHRHDPATMGERVDFHAFYQRLLDYYGDADMSYSEGYTLTSDGKVGSLTELAGKAKLIVVEAGMNDLLSRSLYTAAGKLQSSMSGISDFSPDIIAKLVANLYTEFTRLQSSYSLLLQRLRELNPEATIVTVGLCNVAFNMPLTDDSVLPVGTALSVLTEAVNTTLKGFAEQYGTVFVDISNVDLGGAQYEMSVASGLGENANDMIHPTPEGHAQMARLILAALNGNSGEKTDISIDIGRFERIDYVLVDGVPFTDYSVNDKVLTIPYGSGEAKSLTIAVADGMKVAVSTYSLSFNDDTGYTLHRTYTTNSVFATASKLITRLFSIIRELFNSFF